MNLKECPQLRKRIVAIALGVTVAIGTAQAGDAQRTIRKDVFLEDTYQIYENGHQVGTVRPDPLLKDQYEVQDQRGRPVGEVHKDPFLNDQWDFKGHDAGD